MTHKYLVGYAGEGQVVYGADEPFGTYPMSLSEAVDRRKQLNDTKKHRVRLYKLVVVREWVNGRVKR